MTLNKPIQQAILVAAFSAVFTLRADESQKAEADPKPAANESTPLEAPKPQAEAPSTVNEGPSSEAKSEDAKSTDDSADASKKEESPKEDQAEEEAVKDDETPAPKDASSKDDPDVKKRKKTKFPLRKDGWKKKPFTVIRGEMKDVIEDLGDGKTKPPSTISQPRIIKRLDVMIAEIEEMMKKSGGAGMGRGRPAEQSRLVKGKMGKMDLNDERKDGKKWAELTPKEREKILQSRTEGFPAGYEDVLADYFRRLSRAESNTTAANTGAEANQGENPVTDDPNRGNGAANP